VIWDSRNRLLELPSKAVSPPAQSYGLVSYYGSTLRNTETCSWTAASNRRVTSYARAVFQERSVATPHGFQGL
jgi:hypothetical protein